MKIENQDEAPLRVVRVSSITFTPIFRAPQQYTFECYYVVAQTFCVTDRYRHQ